jgi:hypothetical protein
LTQFKLLLYSSLSSIKDKNPVSKKMMDDLNIQIPHDLDELSALGLVTADVTSTSPALRYLACNGSTAPLDAQDGLGFEILVRHHLVRLCEAYKSCREQTGQGSVDHWVGEHSLSNAWPPASTLGDLALINHEETSDEVEQRYKDTSYDDDIDAIMKILEDKKGDFDLIMRQTASNAQGADLMILSRKDGEVLLHLFQCKNWTEIPKVRSDKFLKAFWSLGVKMDKGGEVNYEPNHGSAGYSYLGCQYFAKKLGERLGNQVTIGDRILVFSKKWNQDSNALQLAFDKRVVVWTQEMLEPTISALY